MTAKIAYFVPNLTDPAVQRRVRMLEVGGATVKPLGFRRSSKPIAAVGGIPAVDLGRTEDGMLAKRAISVVTALGRLDAIAQYVRGSDVVLARNLEMLILAARARNHYAPQARLVFECLDIHRMLLSDGIAGRILRFLEFRLWHDVDLLLTSSPAFMRNYFVPRGFVAPIKIVENKLLLLDNNQICMAAKPRPVGPPWRIGWFGMIRCRQSLDMLSSLAREMKGAVEVVIRGRPSAAVFSNFEAALAGHPHIRYAGPYRNPDDLPKIYREVHFAWAIDFFEKGQNSTWLLPNRIYESTACGTVPIGLAGVETGTWLAQYEAGILLSEPLEERLAAFFKSLDQRYYAKLGQAVDTIPLNKVVSDRAECNDLVNALQGVDRIDDLRNDYSISVGSDPESTSSRAGQ